jgi:hypothetical protein
MKFADQVNKLEHLYFDLDRSIHRLCRDFQIKNKEFSDRILFTGLMNFYCFMISQLSTVKSSLSILLPSKMSLKELFAISMFQ